MDLNLEEKKQQAEQKLETAKATALAGVEKQKKKISAVKKQGDTKLAEGKAKQNALQKKASNAKQKAEQKAKEKLKGKLKGLGL